MLSWHTQTLLLLQFEIQKLILNLVLAVLALYRWAVQYWRNKNDQKLAAAQLKLFVFFLKEDFFNVLKHYHWSEK